MTLAIIISIGCLIIAYLIFQPAIRNRKRRIVKNDEFSQASRQKLSSLWPLYNRLPDLLKQRLHEQINLFLNEKQFIGCNGFVVAEEHKLLIAAQACLLIINKPFEYFDDLKFILIYPSAFIVNHEQLLPNGTISENVNVNSGEAWQSGKIVLSWDDAYKGMINAIDGHNVVIHEFAHLMDHTNGTANGAPLLQHAKNYELWSSVFSSAFERLQRSTSNGENTLFNPYGAISPGEFFAVSSELFFEQSKPFYRQEPELYQQLVKFYSVDPTLW